MARRLSRRVRWLDYRPVSRTVGDLYFEVGLGAPEAETRIRWVRIVRGKHSRLRWWMEHVLVYTNAKWVQDITYSREETQS